jgi:hypothetical protein
MTELKDRIALESDGTSNGSRWSVIVVAIFAVLSFACAIVSPGFVAADACTHYLYAKYAFADPVNLVDVWARPLCTLVFAIGAQLGGRLGVRFVCIAIAISCGLVASAIARAQNSRRPELAMLFTFAGPLFFLFSFSEMTELPFALVLGAAVLSYQKKRWMIFALLAGLLPTARPEGFGFVVLAGLALMLQTRWVALIVLMAPLLAWDLAGWVLTHRVGPWYAWLGHAWPWSEHSLYGRGSIFTFAAAVPLIVSPLILPATIVGVWQYIRSFFSSAVGAPRSILQHENVVRLMIAFIPLSVLIGHSVLRWLGRFGSFGEARYLLVAAPLWGVLSARGWNWIFEQMQWKHAMRWAVTAVCLPFTVNCFYPVVPIRLAKDWQVAARFAEAYKAQSSAGIHYRVIASHPGIFYFLGIDPNAGDRQNAFTTSLIASPPPGAVLVWDPIYSSRNASADDAATLDAIDSAGWISDMELTNAINESNSSSSITTNDLTRWHVFRSRAGAR